MDLKERLHKRLALDDTRFNLVLNLLQRYRIVPSIRNFDSLGLILFDNRGSSVRICFGDYRGKMVHIQDPQTDVAIIFAENMLSGWIEKEKLQDIEDRMLVDVKSLHKMPQDFLFIQECPHLEVFGGFYDGEVWTCARCKEQLVFNE